MYVSYTPDVSDILTVYSFKALNARIYETSTIQPTYKLYHHPETGHTLVGFVNFIYTKRVSKRATKQDTQVGGKPQEIQFGDVMLLY